MVGLRLPGFDFEITLWAGVKHQELLFTRTGNDKEDSSTTEVHSKGVFVFHLIPFIANALLHY